MKRLHTAARAATATMLMAGALVLPATAQVEAADAVDILFVSANTSLPGGDLAIHDHLVAAGHSVTVVDDNALTLAQATGHELAIVSTTVNPAAVGAKFNDAAMPVITWERKLYDDLGLVAVEADAGETGTTKNLAIAAPTHPIATGLGGTVAVTTKNHGLSRGVPGAAAEIVATDTAGTNAVIFTYDEGELLANGLAAPANRVALFLTYNSGKHWTANAQLLLDNAIDWALDGGTVDPPDNVAPTVDAGADQTVDDGDVVTLAGTVADDGLPVAAPTITWSGPAGVSFGDASSPTSTATFPGVGVYTLTLTADDTEFSAADTVDIEIVTPSASPDVLWVAAKANPTSGDAPGIARLEAAGMTVTVMDDDTTSEADAIGRDLVVVSSTISPSRFDAWYATLPVPIFVWEAFVFDDLGFVSAGNQQGQVSGFSKIDIEDAGHSAAGGLTGNPKVLKSNSTMSWAIPAGDVDVIATIDNSTTRAAVFAYDQGAQMAVEPAPARRLGFFLAYAGPNKLSPEGWTMWDAAIDWALNGDEPTFPPVADIAADATTGTAPVSINFDGSGSTDPDDDIASYNWDFGDGALTQTVTPTVSHTYTSGGTFTATLTVTDQAGGSATDDITITLDEAPPVWQFADRNYRVRIDLPGGVERDNQVAAVPIDFTDLFGQFGPGSRVFDPGSLAVTEVSASGALREPDVAHQFDPAPNFDPTTNAVGELVVLLESITGANTTRYVDVYFDTVGNSATPQTFVDQVAVTTGVIDEGLDAIRFVTPWATWSYDENGGGFISLDDIDGNDWISYNSAAGSSGQFRGVPNAVHPEGLLRPGGGGVTTQILGDGPVRATIESVTDDGLWRSRWHVYPTHAEMIMLEADGDYWFLYEGTPGGSLQLTSDTVTRSNGTVTKAWQKFIGDLAGDEWVFFSDVATDRSLFVAHAESDSISDHYKHLDGQMTVFGFGRATAVAPLLSAVPQRFVLGLVDDRGFAPFPTVVEAATTPVVPVVGSAETQLIVPLPPIAAAQLTSSQGSITLGEAPFTIDFDATSSSDPDGTVVSYAWDFGDGTVVAPSANPTVSHTFTAIGQLTATLTVTDNDGLTGDTQFDLTVGSTRQERVSDGLLALYEFNETSGVDVLDTSGVGTPMHLDFDSASTVTHLPGGGLRLDAATKISSDGAATKIIDAVVASNELTLEAWVDPANLTQNGPARIAGISSSTSRRNVMLGQGVFGSTGDRVEARVRTTTSGLNGVTQTRSAVGTLSDQLTHLVVTRAADGTITLFIDGEAVVVDDENGNLGNWDTTMPLLIGAEQGGTRHWLGDLHLVAFYDRALDAGEVCINRSAGPGHDLAGPNVDPNACLLAPAQSDVFDEVTFDASNSGDPDGLAVNYAWDFGDGQIVASGQPTITHRFQADGTFTVAVTVTDDDGGTTSASADVIILPAGGGQRWTEIVSPDPRLPAPRAGSGASQQVASQIGDLDGDGKNDFVIVDRTTPGPSIVWYRFVDVATGWTVHTIEDDVLPLEAGGDIFDIDGDGDLDLLFGGSNQSGDMWWWENPLPGAAPTNEWTRHLLKSNASRKHHDSLFGDVDDDGDAELVYWNQAPQEDGYRLFVAEIPADPTQLWTSTEIYQAGEDSEGLDLADIDLDGVVDIVGGGLWFKRETNGTYTPNVIDAGSARTRTAVGQLIPGGRPEVVIDSGDGVGPLTWFQWNGSTWVGTELIETSSFGHSLRLADMNGDGNLDIFTAEMLSPDNLDPFQNPSATTRIFMGDGAGGFDSETVAVGVDSHESRVGDLDGDGDIDILGKPFNIGAPGVQVWLNEGPDPFNNYERDLVDGSRPWQAFFVEHADIDGDTYDDIVTGGWWYRNPGPAGGAWVRNTIGGLMKQMAAVGDLDGDGDLDVIGTSAENAQANADFHWARNDGSGNFTIFPVVNTDDSGRFLQGATLAQLTVGGPLELVLSWHDVDPGIRTIEIPSNLDANPNQAPWSERSLSTHAEGEQIVVIDVDGDTDMDIITGTKWLRQNAVGTFTEFDLFTPRSNAPDRIVNADIDGDGDQDIVIGFEQGDGVVSSLSWFERPANPELLWTEHPISTVPNMQSVDVADLDGDGDQDIVAGEHNLSMPDDSRLFLYEQLDDGSFDTHLVFVGDEHHDGTQFVDLDLDGDLDIVSIGFVQQRVVAYYNTAT